MGLFDIINSISNNGILKNPGDNLSAQITKSGKQVIKVHTSTVKRSATRYPSTGTIVETIVHKNNQ